MHENPQALSRSCDLRIARQLLQRPLRPSGPFNLASLVQAMVEVECHEPIGADQNKPHSHKRERPLFGSQERSLRLGE